MRHKVKDPNVQNKTLSRPSVPNPRSPLQHSSLGAVFTGPYSRARRDLRRCKSFLFEETTKLDEVVISEPQITAIALPTPADRTALIDRDANTSRPGAPRIEAPAPKQNPGDQSKQQVQQVKSRLHTSTSQSQARTPSSAADSASSALASRAIALPRPSSVPSAVPVVPSAPRVETVPPRTEVEIEIVQTRVHLTRIESGESLFDVVSRYRLKVADLMTALEGNAALRKQLRGIRPGQRVFLEAPRNSDAILRFAVDMRGDNTLVVTRHNERDSASTPSYKVRSMPDRSIWKSAQTLALTEEARRQHPPIPIESTSKSPSPASGAQSAGDATSQSVGEATQLGVEVAETAPTRDIRSSKYKAYLSQKEQLSCERLLAKKPVSRSMSTDLCRQRTLKVRPGDSLYNLFKENGIDTKSLIQMASVRHGEHLQRLRPGQTLNLHIDKKGIVHRLAIPLSIEEQLLFSRRDTTYTSELSETPLKRRQVSASGVVQSSLFAAGQRAGLPDKLVMELVNIFAWDIDFSEEVRPGDSFKVVYEELLHEGEVISVGRILAAEFGNRGERKRAIRFEDEKGLAAYYTPKGYGMRKAFLRNPVEFSRISSRFNLRRRHPILHKIRAHKGVDYAAATGTPVRAAGAGVVESAGRQRGYGKTVVLKHGKKYTTLYAHLSKYGKGIKRGVKVKQGQVIGYVGSTGLATGPHLHYEFRIDGKHRDPLSVKLPKSLPLERQHRRKFKRLAAPLIAELDALDRTKVASR